MTIAERAITPPQPTATKPPSLVTKLAEVMAAVERIPKRGRNEFHKYDYATEADIAATVRKELASRHVMLIPAILDEKREPVGEKGSVLTTLIMEMEFYDGDSGESIRKPWRGYGSDKDDKGGYKATTGAEKYFLLKTFLLPTGDDPEASDSDAPTQRRSGKPRLINRATGEELPEKEYISDAQRKAFFALATEQKWERESLKRWLLEVHSIASTAQIPAEKYAALCEQLKDEPTRTGAHMAF